MGHLFSRDQSSHTDNVDIPDDDSHYDEESDNESGDATEREDVNPDSVVTKSVCRLKEDQCGFTLPNKVNPHHYHGTGFFGFFHCPDTNIQMYGLFTANHVLETEFMLFVLAHDQHSIKLTFEYIEGKPEKEYLLKPRGIIFACPVLDLTFIQILGEEQAKLINKHGRRFLPLERNVQLKRGEELTIVQHPNNDRMKTATNTLAHLYGFNIAHHVSTTKGSSGSPVLFNDIVIGVHKGGGSTLGYNVAVSTQSVINGIVEACRKNENSNKRLIGPPEHSIPVGIKIKRECKSFNIYKITFKDGKVGYCTPTSYGWYWTFTDPGCYRFPKKRLHEIDWLPLDHNTQSYLVPKDCQLINSCSKE